MDGIRSTIIILLLSTVCFGQVAELDTVTVDTRAINTDTISQDVTKWEMYSKLDTVVVDKNITFKVKEYTGCKWRLIHDGSKVLFLGCSNGKTSTINNLEVFDTKKACFTRADELHLTYNAEDWTDEETDCSCKPSVIDISR